MWLLGAFYRTQGSALATDVIASASEPLFGSLVPAGGQQEPARLQEVGGCQVIDVKTVGKECSTAPGSIDQMLDRVTLLISVRVAPGRLRRCNYACQRA